MTPPTPPEPRAFGQKPFDPQKVTKPRCMDGTYFQKMQEAIVLGEKSRDRWVSMINSIMIAEHRQLAAKHHAKGWNPPTMVETLTAVDNRLRNDPEFSNALGDEAWAYRLTTVYGFAELVTATRENTQVLKGIFEELHAQTINQRRLLTEQRTTNQLLGRLVGQLSVPTERPDPPAPPQRTGD